MMKPNTTMRLHQHLYKFEPSSILACTSWVWACKPTLNIGHISIGPAGFIFFLPLLHLNPFPSEDTSFGCFELDSQKNLHHSSAIGFSILGSLAFQSLASAMQDRIICRTEIVSLRKTVPFLRFQICQQHRARSMLCCLAGTLFIFRRTGISRVAAPVCGSGTPKTAQNSIAFEQWKIMCCGVSSAAPQERHAGLSTTCFLYRFALH